MVQKEMEKFIKLYSVSKYRKNYSKSTTIVYILSIFFLTYTLNSYKSFVFFFKEFEHIPRDSKRLSGKFHFPKCLPCSSTTQFYELRDWYGN